MHVNFSRFIYYDKKYMLIREATTTDIEAIQTLMDRLNTLRSEHFSAENSEFHVRTKPYEKLSEQMLSEYKIYIAEGEKGEVIGFIQGSSHRRNNHKLSQLGYVDELFVTPEHRGTGISHLLFEHLEKYFISIKCDHLVTHTDEENAIALQFYERMGLHRATVELWKKL